MSSESSVKKSVVVEASREVAFRVFTEKMSLWWPAEHHIGKAPMAAILLEPRVSGRWAERGVDGSECNWGRVLAWEPPSRLVLAWQLNAKFEFDPDFETEVEVRFVAEGERKTRVELEHKNLDRFGAAKEQVRAAFESNDGWMLGLNSFARAARREGLKAYVLRLIPPRPTFPVDMSEQERRVMQEHVVYWTGHAQAGTVIAFGPVADPHGAWGVAIVEVDGQATIEKLTAEDPVMRNHLGARYEILPMPQLSLGR